MKTFLIQGLLLFMALMMGAFLGTAAKRKTERDSLLDRRVLETSVKDRECGHWAAWRAMELLGASAPLPRVFELIPPRDEGVSLLDLKTLLEKAGLQVDARQVPFDEFLGSPGIAIVHLSGPDHFLTVTHAERNLIFYFDHHGRRQFMKSGEARKRWSGNVLFVKRPRDRFAPLGLQDRASDDPSPRIQFDALLLDKGDIPRNSPGGSGGKVVFDFPFVNLGQKDLIIESVKTSCNCLTVKKPEKPIAHQQSATITLEFQVGERQSSFLFEALVQSNDPSLPKVVLKAGGNLNSLLEISHPFVDLGDLIPGQKRRIIEYLHYRGEQDFQITRFHSSSKQVQLSLHEELTDDLAREFFHDLGLKKKASREGKYLVIEFLCPEGPPGPLSEVVTLQTTLPQYETVTIPLRGKSVLPVRCFPSILIVEPKGPAQPKKVFLHSPSKKAISFLGLAAAPPGVQAAPIPEDSAKTPKPADGISLAITCEPRVLERVDSVELKIKVEIEGVPLEVPLTLSRGL